MPIIVEIRAAEGGQDARLAARSGYRRAPRDGDRPRAGRPGRTAVPG